MSSNPRDSAVFTSAATWALQFSIALAAGILIFYIVPALDIELGSRSIAFGISTLLSPLLLAFAVSGSVALAILCWRAWLLYVGPWWRRSNGA